MEKTKRPEMTPRERDLFNYLALKFHGKPLPSQSFLAGVFGVHQTRISQLIERLVRKGYITKKSTALVEGGRSNGKSRTTK